MCLSFCKKVLADNTEVLREDQDTLYEKSACIELSGSSVTSLSLVLQSELSAGQITIDSVAVTSKSCPREFSPFIYYSCFSDTYKGHNSNSQLWLTFL